MRVVGDRRPPSASAASAAAMLLAAAASVLGGASLNARLPLIVLELVSIPIGVDAARRLIADGGWRNARWPLVLMSAMLAIPLLQSIPLPPEVWLNVPGQAPRFSAMILEGVPLTWAPLSLDPRATFAAIPALFPPIAMFLATLALSHRERRHIALAWMITVTAGLMLGLAQITQPTGGWAYLYGETNRGSLVGWFANRNQEAALLLALTPLASAFAPGGGRGRWWAASFVLFALAGLAAGRSRAGIVLSLPVLLLSVLVAARKPGRSSGSWRMVTIAGAALVAVVAIGVLASAPILARFGHEAGPEFRYKVWPLIWTEAMHHLPSGSGAGSFDRVFRAIEPLNLLAPAYLNHAHNDYLEVWLEAGVPGAVVMAALMAWIVTAARPAWSRRGDDLARAASVSLMALAVMSWVDYPLRTEALATFAAFCCALLVPRPIPSEALSRRKSGASGPPEISCVVPTFGAVKMVAACLASIRAQRDVRAEIIVSDDSVDDSVRALVEGERERGAPYRYVRGPCSGNPVDNWNHGLDHAIAPLLLLIHQDETLQDPGYLRDAVDAMAAPGVVATIGVARVESGTRSSRHAVASMIGRALPRATWFLPMINWIGPTAAFVCRAPHRFDRGLVQLVDVEFYMRVLATGRYIVLAGERVGSRGYHPGQITARIDPIAVALAELDALRARRPPRVGPLSHAAARLATRARRWSR